MAVLSSYGLGYTCATFRDIYHLLEFMEMGRGHAWSALKEAKRQNVIYRLPHTRGLLRLFVNPCVRSWTLKVRIDDEPWGRKFEEWAVHYQAIQPELIMPAMPPRDETLLEALSQSHLMNAASPVPSGNHQSPQGTEPGPHWGPARGPHTIVGTNRSFNRSTMNGQNAVWKERLRHVQEFFRLSGQAYLDDEMARAIPMWTILAQKEGDVLERALADLEDKERTGSPSLDRARRLIVLVRGWLSTERWHGLFPGAL